jgi:hypothetical protein
MRIYVEMRRVYGNDMIYPKCPTAKLLAELACHATLTQRDLSVIKKLGYEVIRQAEEIKL